MLITINEHDTRPIYQQIVGEIKEQIRTGHLKPGDELPSVREVADMLGINLHTVHRAYQKLRDQGVISLRLGQRARVAPLRPHPASRETVDATLGIRLSELVTEAYHLGLSADDFRELVDEILAAKGEGETRR